MAAIRYVLYFMIIFLNDGHEWYQTLMFINKILLIFYEEIPTIMTMDTLNRYPKPFYKTENSVSNGKPIRQRDKF